MRVPVSVTLGLREEDRVRDLDTEGLAVTVRVRVNEAERLTLAACDAVTPLEHVVDGEGEADKDGVAVVEPLVEDVEEGDAVVLKLQEREDDKLALCVADKVRVAINVGDCEEDELIEGEGAWLGEALVVTVKLSETL